MARIRTVKPEFFLSEKIARLTHAARLTFIGLWTHADDEGRARDSAQIIRGAVWPLDEETVSSKDVESHLEELVEVGVVCRYTVGGARFLHVVNFLEHQRISHPTPSKIPPCPHAEHPTPGTGPRSPDAGEPPEGSGEPPESSGTSLESSGGFPEPCGEPPEDSGGFPELPRGETDQTGAKTFSGGFPEPSGKPPEPSGKTQPRARAREVEKEGEEEKETEERRPARRTPPCDTTQGDAHTLLALWLDYRGAARPPTRIINQVGKNLKTLLADGIPYDDVRRGLSLWESKGLDPAKIDSCVNEIQSRHRNAPSPTATVHSPREPGARPSATARALAEVEAAGEAAKRLAYGTRTTA